MAKHFPHSKAQSAIEYLMTYGWMLLVVAVVGGAIFSMAGEETLVEIRGFDGEDVQVEDFAFDERQNLRFSVKRYSPNQVEIQAINITGNSYSEWKGDLEISLSDGEVIFIDDFEKSDETQKLDIEVIYNSGDFENLAVSGQIEGNLNLEEENTTTLGSGPENTVELLDQMEGDGETEPY